MSMLQTLVDEHPSQQSQQQISSDGEPLASQHSNMQPPQQDDGSSGGGSAHSETFSNGTGRGGDPSGASNPFGSGSNEDCADSRAATQSGSDLGNLSDWALSAASKSTHGSNHSTSGPAADGAEGPASPPSASPPSAHASQQPSQRRMSTRASGGVMYDVLSRHSGRPQAAPTQLQHPPREVTTMERRAFPGLLRT